MVEGSQTEAAPDAGLDSQSDAAANPSDTTAIASGTGTETAASTAGLSSAPMGSTDATWANVTDCPAVQTVERARPLVVTSDGETTIELDLGFGDSTWCVRGTAGSLGQDDGEWGAGVAVSLTLPSADGEDAPLDASALGIVGVRFQVSMSGRPLQVRLFEVNSPEIRIEDYNFERNAFVWGGTNAVELSSHDSYEAAFSEFTLPARTFVPFEFQRELDPRRLMALQFVVANQRGSMNTDYTFCVGKVSWLDACGAVVEATTIGEVDAPE